jgi:hypothetical protein
MNRPPIHVAAYGGAGTRKSTLFATFPQPIVVACFDSVGKDMPYWALGPVSEPAKNEWGGMTRMVGGGKAARLEYYHDPLVQSPRAAARFIDRLTALPTEIKAGKVGTFVLETVTSAMLTSRKMYQYDLESGAKDPRKWYGGSVDVLEEILMIQLPSLHCNVGIGLHVSKTKIEAEGSMVRAPLLPGRLMDTFASQWPEIYRCYIEVDQETGLKIGRLQTIGDERWEAATQIGAPDGVQGHYDNLWARWDKKMKKMSKVSDQDTLAQVGSEVAAKKEG